MRRRCNASAARLGASGLAASRSVKRAQKDGVNARCSACAFAAVLIAGLGALAARAAAAPKLTPEQLDAIEHQGAPTQILRQDYAGARANLVRLGYEPVRFARTFSSCVDDADKRRCAKWPEIESCPDLVNACFYYWRRHRDGRLLIVETADRGADVVIDAWWGHH